MTAGPLLWHPVLAQVERGPGRTAVVAADGSLTYADLERESAALARALAAHGVGAGDRVALFLGKTRHAVAAMLGILRTGAAYVPVDPGQPAQRSAAIIADAEVRAVVAGTAGLAALAPFPDVWRQVAVSVCTDAAPGPAGTGGAATLGWADLPDRGALPDPRTGPDDPAYVLYTSGSTGVPKGVMLSHENARAFVDWGVETFGVTAADRLSNHAPLTFDLSVFDIYAALSAGASVHHVPGRVAPFPRELAAWTVQQELTVWYSVPTALTRLALHGEPERYAFETLRTILFAGEVFPVRHLRKAMAVFARAAFYNLFGPTETNVCTYHPVPRPLPDDLAAVPIGRPCCGDTAEIRDEDGRPVADGDVGELVVGGPTVMLGYWQRPELNRERLVPPLAGQRRPAYRTGDMVRRGPDGVLQYQGRRDAMVKTRGYRVELGEIEHALEAHPGVADAAVVAVPDDEIGARLIAVLVAAADPVPEAELRRHSLGYLPRHAVPEHFEFLPELPLTDRGKRDRVALAQRVRATYAEG